MKFLITENQYKTIRLILNEVDVNKADLVKNDLSDFYKTLENAVNKGGLSQQSNKDLDFQKEVESMQIGLILLGYDLPVYGVDGLFGSETAQAVQKFTKENLTLKESTVSVGPFKGDLQNGPKNHASRAFGNWQSDNAWDLFAPIGTTVNSFTNGVVIKKRQSSGKNSKVYGTQITIKGEDGFPNIFYTHLDGVDLSIGDYVNVGDYIGQVANWPGHKATHVHVGLPYGNHIDDLLVNYDAIFKDGKKIKGYKKNSGEEPLDSVEDVPLNMVKASPEMILKLIEMLKSKNIKSSDIKKHTTGGFTQDYQGTTDDDFFRSILNCIGAPESDENMLFFYAWRQAEGGSAKNNPFNTTKKYADATSYNSVGVKHYKTKSDGINATCQTLKLRYYDCIVNGLRGDIGAKRIAEKCSSSLKTWGTGHLVAKVLNGYEKGSTPKPKKIAS